MAESCGMGVYNGQNRRNPDREIQALGSFCGSFLTTRIGRSVVTTSAICNQQGHPLTLSRSVFVNWYSLLLDAHTPIEMFYFCFFFFFFSFLFFLISCCNSWYPRNCKPQCCIIFSPPIALNESDFASKQLPMSHLLFCFPRRSLLIPH